ncbi:MAG: ribonuclease P protein component [Dehalococcoidia bacterium]|nr:ribonuclease P protein component [Dehalococcoidia bacterium]
MILMQKKEHLTQRSQYETVYSKGRSWVNKLLVVRVVPNELDFNRYGLSVGKRLGNAVVRNRIKRLIRENVRLLKVKQGWDVVFIARNAANKGTYHNIGNSIESLLRRAHLLVEENSMKKKTI